MTMTTRVTLTGLGLLALGACNQATPTGNAATATTTTTTTTTTTAGATAATRVRGTAQSVTPTALTVQTYDGQSATVPLDAGTGYAWVVASDLSTLKNGDFIGTATTGPDDAMKALEVVIFPESMRGTGEGHYGWDTPGVVASAGGGAGANNAMTNGTVSSMTNGTVNAMTNGTVTQSAMTNGTVTNGAGASGGTTLTVSYKGGKAQVAVPPGTPIVRFEPTKASSLAKGEKVFAVVPAPGAAAKFVAIGKDGLVPPM